MWNGKIVLKPQGRQKFHKAFSWHRAHFPSVSVSPPVCLSVCLSVCLGGCSLPLFPLSVSLFALSLYPLALLKYQTETINAFPSMWSSLHCSMQMLQMLIGNACTGCVQTSKKEKHLDETSGGRRNSCYATWHFPFWPLQILKARPNACDGGGVITTALMACRRGTVREREWKREREREREWERERKRERQRERGRGREREDSNKSLQRYSQAGI